jgi:Cu(I)/Ag(I) efflux system membrane fusion protein
MKRLAVFCALLLAVSALASASWYGRRDGASAPGLDGRRVLYYVDPMHPAYRSDRPGKAPDCGMALVPVYDSSTSHDAHARVSDVDLPVRMAPETQRIVGVRVQAVEKLPGTESLRLYGRVAPDETRIYRVIAGLDAYVRDISNVTTGTRVETGDWLATLAAPDARTPIQAYIVALDATEQRTLRPSDVPGPPDAGLEQATDRLLTLGMSKTQIEEIKRTRVVPSAIRLTAPAAGFVIARNLTASGKIAIGDELFRIADLRRVWILADVPARDAEYVHPGTIADVTVPGRGIRMRGRISTAVEPQFDGASQSVRLRLEIDNPGAALRPDMSVDVHLPIALPASIAVPVDAVLDTGLRKRVFIERADGAFEPRDVETGWRFGDRVEILRGLTAGDRIVVSGTFLLDSESRMRHAPGGLPPSP